jgi:hypothetical protein
MTWSWSIAVATYLPSPSGHRSASPDAGRSTGMTRLSHDGYCRQQRSSGSCTGPSLCRYETRPLVQGVPSLHRFSSSGTYSNTTMQINQVFSASLGISVASPDLPAWPSIELFGPGERAARCGCGRDPMAKLSGGSAPLSLPQCNERRAKSIRIAAAGVRAPGAEASGSPISPSGRLAGSFCASPCPLNTLPFEEDPPRPAERVFFKAALNDNQLDIHAKSGN